MPANPPHDNTGGEGREVSDRVGEHAVKAEEQRFKGDVVQDRLPSLQRRRDST
jgi:hypothetical protein